MTCSCHGGLSPRPLIRKMHRPLWGILAALLITTCFVATWCKMGAKTDLVVRYKAHLHHSDGTHPHLHHSDGTVWPSPQFWLKLSSEHRAPNTCPFSSCQIHKKKEEHAPAQLLAEGRTCPFYFRYIHEDLAPWAKSGISKEMLDKGRHGANFRVVIKNNRLYVDPYQSCFQTRAVFTLWGILQLLQHYPGLIPDVELLFQCGDTPVVSKQKYATGSPPLMFSYCSTMNDFDIPFPDWSFWGWPEIDLKPWDEEINDILRGQKDILWEERHPVAFWKGNSKTGGSLRKGLQRCNGAHNGAEIIHQDWWAESKKNYKNSKLAQQCKHRYKIYVEGRGWSVSLKYILACDSPVLLVNPKFYDFFSRGLMPMDHFWPIKPDTLCNSIKFAVEWGNNSTVQAEQMGRSGNQYIIKDVSMGYVYDYMLHALREYGKLLRFEPSTETMSELCSEAFLCQAPDRERALFETSRVNGPADLPPCSLPPRDEKLVQETWQRRMHITKQVQTSKG